MSTNTRSGKTDTIAAQTLDQRDIAALTQPMTVMTGVGGVERPEYEVTTEATYIVDLEAETCTCPDHEFRGAHCKHLRRVEFATGRRAIPGYAAQSDSIDDQLGEHIDETPRIAMTDGGVALERDREPISDGIDVAAKVGWVVGIDGEGDVHVHHPTADLVMVYEVADDYEIGDYLTEPVRVQDLEGRTLVEWMHYVEHKRGWQTTTHRAPDEFDAAEEVSA